MKPIGDYTLREIRQRCTAIGNCTQCKLYDHFNNKCQLHESPHDWPIERRMPALLTQDEITRARALRDTLGAVKIRCSHGVALVEFADGQAIPTKPGAFPSLPEGNVVEVENL